MEPQGFNTTVELVWDETTFSNETIKGKIFIYTKQSDGSSFFQDYFVEINNGGIKFHNNGLILPYIHQYIYQDLERIVMTYYNGIKQNSAVRTFFRVKEIE